VTVQMQGCVFYCFSFGIEWHRAVQWHSAVSHV